MVSVIVTYEDGTDRMFEHVVQIRYNGIDKVVEISNDELITCNLPIGKPLWLLTNKGAVSISGTGLRFVETRKE